MESELRDCIFDLKATGELDSQTSVTPNHGNQMSEQFSEMSENVSVIKQERVSCMETLSYLNRLLEKPTGDEPRNKQVKNMELQEHYCDHCGQIFPPLNVIRAHIYHLFHQGTSGSQGLSQTQHSQYTCSDCFTAFPTAEQLELHRSKCLKNTSMPLGEQDLCNVKEEKLEWSSHQENQSSEVTTFPSTSDEHGVQTGHNQETADSSDNDSDVWCDVEDEFESPPNRSGLSSSQYLSHMEPVEEYANTKTQSMLPTLKISKVRSEAMHEMRNKIKGSSPCYCEICHTQFESARGLRIHMTKKHPVQKSDEKFCVKRKRTCTDRGDRVETLAELAVQSFERGESALSHESFSKTGEEGLNEIEDHVKKREGEEDEDSELISCQICNTQISKEGLESHMTQTHQVQVTLRDIYSEQLRAIDGTEVGRFYSHPPIESQDQISFKVENLESDTNAADLREKQREVKKRKWKESEEVPQFHCKICQMDFTKKVGLTVHMTKKHSTRRKEKKVTGTSQLKIRRQKVQVETNVKRPMLSEESTEQVSWTGMKQEYETDEEAQDYSPRKVKRKSKNYDTPSQLSCPICPMQCRNRVGLKVHMTKIHPEQAKQITGVSTKRRKSGPENNFQADSDHSAESAGEDQSLSDREMAGSYFDRDDRSNRQPAENSTLLQCEICHLTFRKKVGLSVHMTKIHRGETRPDQILPPAFTGINIDIPPPLTQPESENDNQGGMEESDNDSDNGSDWHEVPLNEEPIDNDGFMTSHLQGELTPFRCAVCFMQFSTLVGLNVHTTKVHTEDLKQVGESFMNEDKPELNLEKENESGSNSEPEELVSPNDENDPEEQKSDLDANRRESDAEVADDSNQELSDETEGIESPRKGNCEKVTSQPYKIAKTAGRKRRCRRRNFGDDYVDENGIKRPYKCNICGRRCRTPSQLKIHLTTHSDARPFPCDECDRCFKNTDTLRIHKYLHTRRTKSYKCHICDKSFYRFSSYQIHLQAHNPLRLHQCDKCDKRYSSRRQLLSHYTIHKVNLLCNICGRVFHRTTNLKDHLQTHTDHKPEICTICGHRSRNKTQLKIHSYTHTPRPLFMCDICGKRYRNPSGLKTHMFTHADGPKPFPCPVCDKEFVVHASLQSHMDVHNRVRKFGCEFCGRKFIRKSNLNGHIRKMHNPDKDRLHCEECEETFPDRHLLKQHMDGHAGKDRAHKCTMCERSFFTGAILKRHYILKHFKDQTHKCNVCKKAFTFVDDLKRHLLSHSAERAYVCPVCDWRFVRKAHLDRHLGTVHRDREDVQNLASLSHVPTTERQRKKVIRTGHPDFGDI